mgnify:CR=1 FL=1
MKKFSVWNSVFFCLCFVALIVAAWTSGFARSDGMPRGEEQKIEALIHAVGQMHGAVFVRNGKSYDASSAVKFLRGKLDARRDEVRSASDFIDKVASFSSTTGKPYMIRYSDGREISTAGFLRAELAKIEGRQ